ncbi:MAG: deoxyuridine 5'-triphosphate nucleotidohydrolase [Clostridia bacterium]|nr:deoxyuridine 5'-triphosphate nucleotidohydrolase [Clostridia bacterium]
MKKVAKFYKVSYDQFSKSCENCLGVMPEDFLQKTYEAIALPKRATKGSAGYDFFTPVDIVLPPKRSIRVPTGIRAQIDDGWVLKIYPRSGLGFKYRLQLDNTVGIIDSDYFHSDNEGHIIIKLTNDTLEDKTLELISGKGFAQGIFIEYGITYDDVSEKLRNGGFGSTEKI